MGDSIYGVRHKPAARYNSRHRGGSCSLFGHCSSNRQSAIPGSNECASSPAGRRAAPGGGSQGMSMGPLPSQQHISAQEQQEHEQNRQKELGPWDHPVGVKGSLTTNTKQGRKKGFSRAGSNFRRGGGIGRDHLTRTSLALLRFYSRSTVRRYRARQAALPPYPRGT